jgi:tetratricopeptide (TPR) repeat protein
LKNSIGDLISINSLLSTNLNRQKVLKNLPDLDELKSVLFEIDADPNLPKIKSFGCTGQDDEILFMVGSIFRVTNINHQKDGLTIIKMTLCSDDDPQLKKIFKSLKTDINEEETNLLLFGEVLWKIGKFNEAEKYYQRLLTELSNDNYHEISECYYALGNLAMEKDDYNSSFEWHQKSLEIKEQLLKENDPSIADSYNSIADIERKKGNLSQALESYNKALDIWTQAYGNDHPKIAMCLNNIGCIYGEEKNYYKTLEYQGKALIIMEKIFPSDHLCLGQAHNNIGSVYRYLGNCELALEHYQISVKIKLKSFSSKHPLIASTFSNIANVYEDMNSLKQALEYYEKAASIYRHRFPPTYPDNIRVIEDIRRVSSKIKG